MVRVEGIVGQDSCLCAAEGILILSVNVLHQVSRNRGKYAQSITMTELRYHRRHIIQTGFLALDMLEAFGYPNPYSGDSDTIYRVHGMV